MAHSRPFGRTAWDKAAGKVTDAPARVPQIQRIWIAEGLSCVFVHRSDLNKFGHLPTAFIELFSTVLVERHGGGAPSEGLCQGEWEVRRGQNPAKSVFWSVCGVKRCAKSNGGCQSDGGQAPDISGSRLGFGASPVSKSPSPGSVL